MAGLTARICNDFLLAQAIDAARELGILDFIATGEVLDVQQFCQTPEVAAEPLIVGKIVELLELADVLTFESTSGRYAKGREFDALYRDRGFVYWTKACGETVALG